MKNSSVAFAGKLFSKLGKAEENAFYSPVSIQTAMGMVTSGAAGTTEKALATALDLPQDRQSRDNYFKEIITKLAKNEKCELVMANALWGAVGYPFKRDYIDRIEVFYQGNLIDVNFADANVTAGLINNWCSKNTRNKIPTIVAPDMLSEDTRLVLTNAIYFKDKWHEQFDKNHTDDRVFYAPEGQKKVKTMRRSGSHLYAETETHQLLQLFYESGLSMQIILPKENQPFGDLQEVYTNLLQNLRQEKVVVYLPKFKLETNYSLNKTFVELGAGEAFSDVANFERIADEGIKISNVIHKAFVDCDEEGTEAAAATAVVAVRSASAIRVKPKTFDANRPFAFMICDQDTVLFTGRVTNP